MRSSWILSVTLLATMAAGSPAATAEAGGLFCCGTDRCCCQQPNVVVHVCRAEEEMADEGARRRWRDRDERAGRLPVATARIVESAPMLAYPMPMYVAPAAPMVVPTEAGFFPRVGAYARGPDSADYLERLNRVESGLKNLHERMEHLEQILERHTAALDIITRRALSKESP